METWVAALIVAAAWALVWFVCIRPMRHRSTGSDTNTQRLAELRAELRALQERRRSHD